MFHLISYLYDKKKLFNKKPQIFLKLIKNNKIISSISLNLIKFLMWGIKWWYCVNLLKFLWNFFLIYKYNYICIKLYLTCIRAMVIFIVFNFSYYFLSNKSFPWFLISYNLELIYYIYCSEVFYYNVSYLFYYNGGRLL